MTAVFMFVKYSYYNLTPSLASYFEKSWCESEFNTIRLNKEIWVSSLCIYLIKS